VHMVNYINIEPAETLSFPSGWSLSPYVVYTSLKYVTYGEKLNILEFGSGQATQILYDLLVNKNIPFEYTSYEHDSNFATTQGVSYKMYSLDNQVFQSEKKFDIIIVDGPNGVNRYKWYGQFKDNVRDGTIILIDDFHHYKEFGDMLDSTFTYETINEFNIDNRFTPIINSGIETVDLNNTSFHGTKTHKIIKVKL
jgi:hypothetical protein